MKKRTSKNSPLFTRAHIYTLTGACVLRRLLAEGISANADTGELHSPYGNKFPTTCVLPKRNRIKKLSDFFGSLIYRHIKVSEKRKEVFSYGDISSLHKDYLKRQRQKCSSSFHLSQWRKDKKRL